MPRTRLVARRARAIRYINAEEAPGSISLAVDPQVITRVRTIPLSPPTPVLPATAAGTDATRQATAELEEAERLRPDTGVVPEDPRFESELLALMTAWIRPVDPHAMDLARRTQAYRHQQHRIWSQLEQVLVDTYLPGVNSWVRERVTAAVPTSRESPADYHDRIRAIAALVVGPHTVIGAFDTAPWRRLCSGNVAVS